jgi:hypothetical protein
VWDVTNGTRCPASEDRAAYSLRGITLYVDHMVYHPAWSVCLLPSCSSCKVFVIRESVK